MSSWAAVAAADNAAWCDVVCRTHGIDAELDLRAWTSPTRTPPLYPDAVTLVDGPPASELLARIDASSGCSVKDTFASLDLSGHGFRVLFEARWIIRGPSAAPTAPTARAGAGWKVVEDVVTFRAWEEAWRGPEGPHDVLRADLLELEAVTFLAAWAGGRIVGGAVLHRSATVVGISNVFCEGSTLSASWQGCIALADVVCPGATLVGYESGEALDAAHEHGFEADGSLRVWLRDS